MKPSDCPVARLQRLGHLLFTPAAHADQRQATDHATHLMVEEAACGGVYAHLFTVSLNIEPIKRLDRILRLALDRAEGCEIVAADERLCGAMHCFVIEILRNLPSAVEIERQGAAPIGNSVNIAAPDAGKARMPILGHFFAMGYGDGIGPQMRVKRLH